MWLHRSTLTFRTADFTFRIRMGKSRLSTRFHEQELAWLVLESRPKHVLRTVPLDLRRQCLGLRRCWRASLQACPAESALQALPASFLALLSFSPARACCRKGLARTCKYVRNKATFASKFVPVQSRKLVHEIISCVFPGIVFAHDTSNIAFQETLPLLPLDLGVHFQLLVV